jgi:hypothetical protein
MHALLLASGEVARPSVFDRLLRATPVKTRSQLMPSMAFKNFSAGTNSVNRVRSFPVES